jgi:hypothetical protein
MGYKQLLEVERDWRTMKTTLDRGRYTTGSKSVSAPTSSAAGWRYC